MIPKAPRPAIVSEGSLKEECTPITDDLFDFILVGVGKFERHLDCLQEARRSWRGRRGRLSATAFTAALSECKKVWPQRLAVCNRKLCQESCS